MSETKYTVTILEIGKWKLKRKLVEDNSYNAMMFHECPNTNLGYRYQNGEYLQECIRCHDHIPDEIWAVWQLLCNDQRMGWTK
jgi:hypothetical protein